MGQKIIDLTLNFANDKLGVNIEQVGFIEKNGYNISQLHISSHALTHMDATKHFLPDGKGMEKIDLNKCMGEALVVDLSHKEPHSLMTVADVESVADQIQAGSRILLRTDWSDHAESDDYRTHYPRISAGLARWLVEKGVWLVGVEAPSVASMRPEEKSELVEVHQILLSAEIVIVEGLCNLNLLPEKVHFIALPLKLVDCDGSPVRAVAVIDT